MSSFTIMLLILSAAVSAALVGATLLAVSLPILLVARGRPRVRSHPADEPTVLMPLPGRLGSRSLETLETVRIRRDR